MSVSWRCNPTKVSTRAVALMMALGLVLLAAACAMSPMRAIRGARHYEAGTEALERHEGARAIVELERAAVLVPRASEIQNHLGLAYWSEGRLEEARAAFERAIELDCGNLAAQANLERWVRSQEPAAGLSAGSSSDILIEVDDDVR